MSNNAEGDRAIAELNGRDLDGRAINVNEARPKEDRGHGGGNADAAAAAVSAATAGNRLY